MARAKPKTHGHKVRVSVTISPELYEWVSRRTGEGREFGSFSHAVERGLAALRTPAEKK